MSTLSLRLPDSLHDMARKIAKKEHLPFNHLISALTTGTYLKRRAAQGL